MTVGQLKKFLRDCDDRKDVHFKVMEDGELVRRELVLVDDRFGKRLVKNGETSIKVKPENVVVLELK